ncbi:MAG: YbfB/YjiJ family MFS transporter [Limnobaculum xujianqingii]
MALRIAFSGFIALVVAMGIGRFAFTPQVPLMLAEGDFSLTGAGIVAAFNYLGYLCGSYDAMRSSRHVEYRLWGGVWGAVLLTLLSGVVSGIYWHSLIRFAIGWASGWGLVMVAAWTNERLLTLGKPGLAAAVFAGPGAGIFLSGMLAVLFHTFSWNAQTAWFGYGCIALVLVACVTINFPRKGELHRAGGVVQSPLVMTRKVKRLVLSYSLAGFGYILPATFLSQMAVQRFPDSLFAQFVWPVFGAASVVGIAIGIMTRHYFSTPTPVRLAIALWLQAIGIVCAELVPGISGLVIGATLVGGAFLCVVQLALQYGRELAPDYARYMAGLLTTGYAVGQLVGPMLSALSTVLTHRLEPALYVAALALLLAGFLVWPEKVKQSERESAEA